MLEFLRRYRVLLLSGFLLVVGAALVLRTGDARIRDDRLGGLFLEIVSLPQRPVAAVGRALRRVRRNVRDLLRAQQQLAGLRGRVKQLEQDAARLGEVEHENARLRELLDFRQTVRGEVVGARVIGRDAGTLARTVVIDRGERDGLARGAAVFVPGGVVGRVFQTAPHAARVLLVSDHNSGLDAIVQRTRARGIIEGSVDGGCVLKFVKRTEDVQVGDLVVTSGGDGIFPAGLPVGHVTAVDKKGKGLFQIAEVTPSADLDDLDEVLVTKGPVAVEVPPMEPPGGRNMSPAQG